ncbi:unnamed protein product [Cuscuta campestris]|uniref:Uncharacterized protein n=1 Tax=Cuscuta campestris TaxID=132261 RepID=A0A484KT08_9ASTE|nr:unnamed protein product [Cuscuta campestris]
METANRINGKAATQKWRKWRRLGESPILYIRGIRPDLMKRHNCKETWRFFRRTIKNHRERLTKEQYRDVASPK